MVEKPTQPQAHDIVFFPPPDSVLGQHYRYVTQRPWPSLLFVLPMLLVFEIGTWLRNGDGAVGESQLVATYLIDLTIKALGASGAYFPGLLMVVILLAIHIVGKHPWKFDIYVLPAMLGESSVWTIPLFVFDCVLHTAIVAGQASASTAWLDEVIRSFGAGLYEELVFRLICITVLTIVLIDVFKLPRAASAMFAILGSAALFAAHHHPPLGDRAFETTEFIFRTGSGIFLAGLFIFRGFGIAAGCHAFYNVIVVTIEAVHH